jgi:propanol-preferring alcohol dehydrogenase
MRALVLHAPASIRSAPLRSVELPDPEVRDDELRIAISACGVCRTDLQLVEGDVPAHRLPIVPGHQVVGRVDAVGRSVTGWRPGDRVGAVWLAGACGACPFCRSGRENLCLQATFTGWDRDGGYADRMTVRADFATRLPAGFSDLAAAPLLCGGVIGYRALKLTGVGSGGRLGLYGFGSSASLAIQVARHWDCEVYVASRSAADLARAEALGAVWVGRYDERPPVPLDAAITFAPVGDVVIDALRAVDRGATVVINAIHLDRVPEFAYESIWWERSLRSVANVTRADAREFLELAAAIPIRPESDVFPLEAANEALQRLAEGRTRGAAVLIGRESDAAGTQGPSESTDPDPDRSGGRMGQPEVTDGTPPNAPSERG